MRQKRECLREAPAPNDGYKYTGVRWREKQEKKMEKKKPPPTMAEATVVD
jgi:hypothetical protein